MNARKIKLRQIVLDMVLGREQVTYRPSQFNHLVLGVAEVLGRTENTGRSTVSFYQPEPRLAEDDEMMVQEIFWDLVIEKVLTIGLNGANSKYPFFRLHSEAQEKLPS